MSASLLSFLVAAVGTALIGTLAREGRMRA
jgi:hypothetical protein